MTSTISKYFSGSKGAKRKQISSSSSSDCASPEPSSWEKRQRQEDTEEEMGVQEILCEMQATMAKLSTKEDVQQIKTEIQQIREDVEKLAESLTLRIDKLEGTVFELANDKDKLKAEVKKLRAENTELQNQLVQHSKSAGDIQRALNDQEQHGRQWNLRVFGVRENAGETVEDCVAKCADIFSTKLGVPVSATEVEIAHRSGKAPAPGGRPRPILVRFHSRRQRGVVLTARRKLKGSGITIGEDLTHQNYRLLQKVNQHSATLSTWSSNGKIMTKLKNGKVIKLDIDKDVNTVISKEM